MDEYFNEYEPINLEPDDSEEFAVFVEEQGLTNRE